MVQIDPAKINIYERLRKKFIEQGVWLRPFRDIIYIMPAFMITQQELAQLTQSVVDILKTQDKS